MGPSTTTPIPRCANHPSVETLVSCANCGKPICPDCMVQAPVGIKCASCARMPRSARVRLQARSRAAGGRRGASPSPPSSASGSRRSRPRRSASSASSSPTASVAAPASSCCARAAASAGPTTGAIAAAGALGAYLSPFVLAPLIYGDRLSRRFGVIEVVLGCVAGVLRLPAGCVAWPREGVGVRHASSPAASSAPCSSVGRRRRYSSEPGLRAFEDAPCFRELVRRTARRAAQRRPAAVPEGNGGRWEDVVRASSGGYR